MKDKVEKVDVEQMTKNLRVNNMDAFSNYLKDVYTDLYGRVIENKNDPKEKQVKQQGVTKSVFDKYYELPGIIGDRLFHVFNKNNREYITLKEFSSGMKNLFCDDFDKTSKFIFDFYDSDNNGKINKEDIRTILSYITLGDDVSSKTPMKNLSYTKRINSQEELNNILQICFKDIKGEYMTYEDFKKVIEEVNSDIYLMIYLFLLGNKPFKKENIESYIKPEERKAHSPKSPKKMIASPSKNTHFSPYKKLGKRKSVVLDSGTIGNIHKIMDSPLKSPNDKRFKRRKSVEKKEPLILLQNMELGNEEDKKEKEINDKRVHC